MQQETIKMLNQLNRDFYQRVADDFSESRQYYWSGWQKIPLFFKKNQQNAKKIQVLDVGCGNARFAKFLKKNNFNFNYIGIDNSAKLLKIAQDTLQKEAISAELIEFDLIDHYLANQQITWPVAEKFDLIVVFGLTHHLPSAQLRLQFFQSLAKLLKKDALLVVSNWQFAVDKRFQKNIISRQKNQPTSKINTSPIIKLQKILNKLEKNDYLLDWRQTTQKSNGDTSIRYCHYLDEKNSKILFKKADLKIVDQFFADGKSQRLNQYFVLKKAN